MWYNIKMIASNRLIINHTRDPLPVSVISLKALKAERDQLLQMKDAQAGTYQYFKDYQKELRTASTNVDTILGIDRTRTQDREKAQDIS